MTASSPALALSVFPFATKSYFRFSEGALTMGNSLDGPRVHCAESNKPVGERQIPYDFTYMGGSNEHNKQTDEIEKD